MAVAFRSEAHVIGSGGNPTVAEPAGAVQGDVFVGFFLQATQAGTPAAPAGWTVLYSGTSSTPAFKYNLAYIVRGASAPSLTWTMANPPAYREVFVLAFSGCDTVTPIDASVDGGNATGVNPDAPAVVAVSGSAMALAVGIGWSGSAAGGWTAPANYTIRTDNANGNDGVVATRLLTQAGSENPAAFANGTASDDLWSATVTLDPVPVAVSAVTEFGVPMMAGPGHWPRAFGEKFQSDPTPAVTDVTVVAPAAEAIASVVAPVLDVDVVGAAATATASVTTPTLSVQAISPAAGATAAAAATLQIDLIAGAALATASVTAPGAGPTPTPPTATATAGALAPALALDLSPPAALATAGVVAPGLQVDLVAGPALATAGADAPQALIDVPYAPQPRGVPMRSGPGHWPRAFGESFQSGDTPPPTGDIQINPPAAIATASAAATAALDLPSVAATATAGAAANVQVSTSPPAASATATAAATLAAALAPPAASATAGSAAPALRIQLTAGAAIATASVTTPGVGPTPSPPAATAAASSTAPGLRVAIQVTAASAIASADAPAVGGGAPDLNPIRLIVYTPGALQATETGALKHTHAGQLVHRE